MKTQLRILTIIIYCSSLTFNAFADTKTLTSTADTYVSIDAQSYNFGSETSIAISTYQSILGYLKFNLSSIPSNVTITSAKLKLYCSSSAFSTGTILISRAYTSWSESTLTWGSRPSGVAPIVTYNATGSTGWWTITVTSIVKEWLEKGESNFGFRFEKAESGLISVSSRENTSYAPKLEITYEVNRFTASGKVLGSLNEGVQQVELTFSRISGSGSVPNSVYTSSAGEWFQSDFEEGTTYKVTPKHTVLNYVFTPSSRNFDGTNGNVTGLNFTTTTTYSVSFTSSPDGASVSTNGFSTKTTPCTFTGLTGNIIFTIAKSGYHSQDYVVTP